MKKGLLIIIAGPSGVGKGTVREEVMKKKSLNLAYSVSCTTRKPRPKEKNGVDYFFISKQDFLKRIKEKEFLEYAQFVGNYYGTSKKFINSLRESGKNVVLEIEVKGTKQIIKQFKKSELITFFLIPPTLKDLEKRIRGRSTETDEVIKGRLAKAKIELKEKKYFDYVIVNDTPKRAANEIIKNINKAIKARG